MATDASDDLSSNIHIANVVFKYRGLFRCTPDSTGPITLLVGRVRVAANGTIVRTGFREILYFHATNLTDTNVTATNAEVQIAISTGNVTMNTNTTGDDVMFKCAGRGR